jgi:hypothetical protein
VLAEYTTLTLDQASYDEGDTIIVALNSTNIPDGTTVGYTVTGMSFGDLVSGATTGTFTINSNIAFREFVLNEDGLTEGPDTFTITLAAQDSLGNTTSSLSASATVNDTSFDPNNVLWLDDNDNPVTVRTIIGATSMQLNGVFAANPTVPRTIEGRSSGAQTTITAITARTATYIEVDDTGNSTSFIVGEQLNLVLADTFNGLSQLVTISESGVSGFQPSIATNNAGLFVATTGNYFATSTNGTTWSSWNTFSNIAAAFQVYYVNGQFVALGNDPFQSPSTPYISIFNGTSWSTAIQMDTGNVSYSSIAHNGSNLYIAVGVDGSVGGPVYATSTDGTTWSAPTNFPGDEPPPGGGMNSIIYQDNKFVTMGFNGYYYVYTNGSWSSRAQIPNAGGSSIIVGLTYSETLGRYVGVGTNFQGGADSGNRPILTTSIDGSTWTAMTTLTDIKGALTDVTSYNDTFLAVGINNPGVTGEALYYSSTDGITWTRATLTPAARLTSAVYGAGRFVVIGRDGTTGNTNTDLIVVTYSNIFS